VRKMRKRVQKRQRERERLWALRVHSIPPHSSREERSLIEIWLKSQGSIIKHSWHLSSFRCKYQTRRS
jgi:hypothetical protein